VSSAQQILPKINTKLTYTVQNSFSTKKQKNAAFRARDRRGEEQGGAGW
jgi:hypothetical protein